MEKMRGPFQGLKNVIRFNWHYYIIGAVLIMVALFLQGNFDKPIADVITIIAYLLLFIMILSLLATYYIYDLSGFYSLSWLDDMLLQEGNKIVNINAGFDETSELLTRKFPSAHLTVYDFYDPALHTEISIKRARRSYPSFQGTIKIHTDRIPLQDSSSNGIFIILSAHEIRNETERISFFRELRRVLRQGGFILVTEHTRNLANFLAYNIGFFHFYSANTWRNDFRKAGLTIVKEKNLTPFIKTFILHKNGTAS